MTDLSDISIDVQRFHYYTGDVVTYLKDPISAEWRVFRAAQ